MSKKAKIIVSISGIVLVMLILLGLTYAYFLTRIQGNTNDKSISVTTANLELTYADGNGTITSNNIMPGTTLTDKEFTVTNNGNATVNNYAVYLEELVNELTRPDDMVYTLTCTSSKANKTCNGVSESTFPKLAGIIVTNSIEVGETQTYKLTVTYKEMGVDQSDDMNKKVSARVQIYNLQDIVDVTGTVTNASAGDYVEMHSNPKTSMITTDNKYLIAAVEPGTHTIYVKDKEGTVKGSKEITIKKGNTASVSGTNITVTNDSQTVNVDIKSIATTLTIDIGETKDYSPFDEGTLASAIYISAKTKANGTELLSSPRSRVAVTTSQYGTGKFKYETVTTGSLCAGYNAWLVGDNGVAAKSGSTVSSYDEAVGKYVYDQCSSWTKYLESYDASASTLKFKSEEMQKEVLMSVTLDDYGTSYYYRGGIEDNYVNFAGMCWRAVRIAGDGSVKLILEDLDSTCATSDGNWDIPTTTGGTTKTGNFGYTEYAAKTLTASDGTQNSYTKRLMNYLNGETNKDKSMATAFKNFQTGPLANYLDKLKAGDWCLNDKAYGTSNDNTTALTSQEILDKQVKNTSFYYDTNVRLDGKTTKEPTLKCNGTNMNKFADNTDMYVGTLTADEIVYAGGLTNVTNDLDYYLINDYQKTNSLSFWPLSPIYFDGDSDRAFCVYSAGFFGNNDVSDDVSFRPAVSLKSSVQITGGNGTKANAYTIG